MIDSSMFFYSKQIPLRKRRQITWSDSVGVDINYNKKGIITSKGMISKEDVNRRTGKWAFYGKDRDSVIEYLDINNATYVNQYWLTNKSVDTLSGRGN
jgi:hypothetical protein